MLSLMGGEEGDYDFEGMDFDPPVDIPASARSYGAEARLVESADELRAALAEARDRRGPTVLDVPVHD